MTGKRIRELREAAGLTQRVVAAEMRRRMGGGWAQSKLCAIEKGKRPLDPDDYHELVLAISEIKAQGDADYDRVRRA